MTYKSTLKDLGMKKLSIFAGMLTKIDNPAFVQYVIKKFIKKYKVELDEYLLTETEQYRTFHDFFIRKINPKYRPFERDDNIFASPCDGLVTQKHENYEDINVKNHQFKLADLLANNDEYDFMNGSGATIYLSPKDYHRVHMPFNGFLKKILFVPGSLYSVKPSVVKNNPNILSKNERTILFFETKHGNMAVILIGAFLVGSMHTPWTKTIVKTNEISIFDYTKSNNEVLKGDEIGYFNFGSTVILLTNFKLNWLENFKKNTEVKLGGSIGIL